MPTRTAKSSASNPNRLFNDLDQYNPISTQLLRIGIGVSERVSLVHSKDAGRVAAGHTTAFGRGFSSVGVGVRRYEGWTGTEFFGYDFFPRPSATSLRPSRSRVGRVGMPDLASHPIRA